MTSNIKTAMRSFLSSRRRLLYNYKCSNTSLGRSLHLGIKKNLVEGNCMFSDGKAMLISSGKLAKLADGCAVAKMGETSVMVTTVAKNSKSSSGFVPLVVDYRQKSAAAGRIPTNFLRRELGPTEKEILTSRLIDRSIRPLFPQNFSFETQVMCNLLSVDGQHDPDVLSINAASAALSLSDIPWDGPIGAVRIGMLSNELVINPTRKDLASSSLNLVVVATGQNLVVMLESSGDNILQQDVLKAVKLGVKETQIIVGAIGKMQKEHGRKKREIGGSSSSGELGSELLDSLKACSQIHLKEIFTDFTLDKLKRDMAVTELRVNVIEKMRESYPQADLSLIIENFGKLVKSTLRQQILEEKIRCDGRSYTELRNISCEVDLYKPLHGSALFQRGQTQVFCTVSFDSIDSVLKLDPLSVITSGLKEKNFFLHYEFPPYATNETGRTGAVGRRELGHGALAEKALRPIVPSDFPHTIRLTSEVLESNGSSSMASVCGGSLALMDAGVPLSAPAAGVAMGLITKYQGTDTKHIEDYCILTDILGIEDYFGDMDFKIAGTKKGITALQLDVKVPGLPLKIVMEAILQGTEAKNEILNIMHETISKPRSEKKDTWPMLEKLDIPVHKRSRFLGYGGRNIKRLLSEVGVQVTQIDDTTWNLFSPNSDALEEAKEMIEGFLAEEREPNLEFGGIYTATIVEIRDSGVMVILYPTMQPVLLHNSQLEHRKIMHPSALGLEAGQKLTVKYYGRDPVSGTMRLSRKVLLGTANNVIKDLSIKKS